MKTTFAVAIALFATVALFAQGGRGGRGGGAPANPRQAAPIDLSGYWVSLVTEDWLYRMVTPAKGDVASVPVNAAGRGAAGAWVPAKDEAAGEQCKAYGAAAIVRVPGRMHIDWLDDTTLKIDFDAGTQTRLLHFGGTAPDSGVANYQGYSVASWEGGGGRGGRGGGGPPAAPAARSGSLKVVTTRLKPGYLRKNGVPYGANATLTEYFDKVTMPGGQALLIVKSIVDDPEFLTEPFITSTHFKQEADGSKWHPSACSAK